MGFRVGAHLETAGAGITISVEQECQIALPLRRNLEPPILTSRIFRVLAHPQRK
jgi:hypothetical protein